jgi:hypothetical protein
VTKRRRVVLASLSSATNIKLSTVCGKCAELGSSQARGVLDGNPVFRPKPNGIRGQPPVFRCVGPWMGSSAPLLGG